MNTKRLKHIRDVAEAYRSKSGYKRREKCLEVIIELLDYIEELKNPKNSEMVETLKKKTILWFNRRESTPLSPSEFKAIKLASCLIITETDLDNLDWWYSLPEGDCFKKYGNGRKKTVASLFNSLGMEMIKAEQARAKFKPKPKPDPYQIIESEYLTWLDSQDFGGRMKPEWRSIATAPQSLKDDFLKTIK